MQKFLKFAFSSITLATLVACGGGEEATANPFADTLAGTWKSACNGVVSNGTFDLVYVKNSDGTLTSTSTDTRYSGASCTGTATVTTQTYLVTLGSSSIISGRTAHRYTYTPVSGPVTTGGKGILVADGTPLQLFEGTGSTDTEGYQSAIASTPTGVKQ
jgi:hypothetical protein